MLIMVQLTILKFFYLNPMLFFDFGIHFTFLKLKLFRLSMRSQGLIGLNIMYEKFTLEDVENIQLDKVNQSAIALQSCFRFY